MVKAFPGHLMYMAVVSRGHMDAGVKEMHDSREGGIRTEEAKAEDAEAAFCFSGGKNQIKGFVFSLLNDYF